MSELMRGKERQFARCSSGQSLLEAALITPLMLLIILNVVNFGYLFVVALNIASGPRSGSEYAMLGFATPGALSLAQADTINSLVQADMASLSNVTSAQIQICTLTNINPGTKSGLNGTGTGTKTNCVTCTGGSCGSVNTGATGKVPAADPEAPNFILARVDVDYSVSPLIPGTPFGILLLPLSTCSASGGSVSCAFHRQVSVRLMD